MKLNYRLMLGLVIVFGFQISARIVTAQTASTSGDSPAEPAIEKSSAKTPSPTPMFTPMPFSPKDNTAFAKKPRRPETADVQTSEPLPRYLKDRGTGMPTSQFGTYVERGEVVVYPFFEYYRDHNFEYKPEEFGFAGNNTDFRGRYRAREALLFVAYGVTENLAVEFEASVIKATFDKSPLDRSALPARIEESGLGDVEGQIRYRWLKENEHRPEVFSYFEFVVPHHKRKKLIGTPAVELKFGTGVTRGFDWGTMTFRGSVAYDGSSTSKFDIGEFAVEYLKRLSPKWQLYVGVEGTPDELSLIPQLQWRISRNVTIKFNSGIGLTSRATDFAPEIGVVFSFGGKH
jgi:hypothetical protein